MPNSGESEDTLGSSSEKFNAERRKAMKKILLGGALIGSVAMFGSSLLPSLSRSLVSDGYFANGSGLLPPSTLALLEEASLSYPSSSNQLPKPANPPSLLYLGSYNEGVPSLQLAVIAGILARNQPVLYLTDDTFTDGNIQQALSNHYGVSFNSSQSTSGLISMLGSQAFGNPARWIRYNADYDMGSALGQNDAVDQLNAVRSMCGVFNALPVPAGQDPPISSESEPMFDISSWGTSVPLYQQVWNIISGSIGKQWLAINPPNGNSPRLNMTDYMVMSKAFSFQVPLVRFNSAYASVQAQKNFAASVIDAYPTPYAVLGYTGIGTPTGGSSEVDFVSALSGGSGASNSSLGGSSPSAHGGGYYTGSQRVGNMTVKSAFAPFSGALFPDPLGIPAYDARQNYITIIASQGDCLDWTEDNIASYMLQSQSVGLPIGLTMTQTAQWLDPAIVHWYIDNISSSTGILTSGSAGMGYNHVTELPDVSQFLTTGAQNGSNVNIKDFFFIDGPGVNPLANGGTVANQYISGLKNGGIIPRALWWWSPWSVPPSIINGTPCFFTSLNISETNISTQDQCDSAIASAIRNAHSNFVIFFLNAIWPNPTCLMNSCSRYGITPLSPGTFANLFRASHGLTQI